MSERLGPNARGQIDLRDVRKSFGDVVAVDGVSLAVAPGSFFSLLGPSGCGKTTTLRVIAGFVHPDAGDVLIDGRSIVPDPPHRRNVNTVFQQYALFPHLDVFDNIAFGLTMKRIPKAEIVHRVGDMLDMVRLLGYEGRKPAELSGGEQQRVALARALVNRPAILLLDEPLAALDLKLRKQMQQELKLLQHEVGVTFLYVTHDQEEAMALSDRIAVMRSGAVQQVGTPEQVYEEPANRFVADFIGISNLMDGLVIEERPSAVCIALNSGDEGEQAVAVWAGTFDAPEIGGRVTISVRPERVHLLDVATGDANTYTATVVDRAYLGTDIQYRVRLTNGTVLTSVHPNRDGTPRCINGDEVTVEFAPEDVRVLSD